MSKKQTLEDILDVVSRMSDMMNDQLLLKEQLARIEETQKAILKLLEEKSVPLLKDEKPEPNPPTDIFSEAKKLMQAFSEAGIPISNADAAAIVQKGVKLKQCKTEIEKIGAMPHKSKSQKKERNRKKEAFLARLKI